MLQRIVNESPISRVINDGYCIGCGACSAIDKGFSVRLADNGELRVLSVPFGADLARASRVCPMGDAPNEDEIGSAIFPATKHYADGIGFYVGLYAGFSNEFRDSGGSGGLTRWLFATLLRTRAVDYVVQVDRKQQGESNAQPLFYYAIHASDEEYLERTSTSAYYPITLSDLFDVIASLPGTCAITALPCFSRAIRSVMIERDDLAQRIKFISGTICGSLKSRRYADYLAAQMGVDSNQLDRINFRGKSLSRTAKEKCVEVWKKGSSEEHPDAASRVQGLKGTDYGLGYFKYKACDYCDDVFAETADIAFGDAWITPYQNDPNGTNVVVVRNPLLVSLLEEASTKGEIKLDALTPAQVLQTQAAGLRHRRSGLAIRLKFVRLTRNWAPNKRVKPSWGRNPLNIAIQACRIVMRRVTSSPSIPISHPLFPILSRAVASLHRLLTRCNNLLTRAGRR